MNRFRLLNLLTLSPFFLQAAVVLIIIFVSSESDCSILRWQIPDDVTILTLLLTYVYPVFVGAFGLICFSLNYFELKQSGAWIKTFLIISAINFLSFIWSYALLVSIFIFVPCFTFRLPL